MSDTPRTDQEKWNEGFAELVTANFARQLERELAEAKKDAERYRWIRLAHQYDNDLGVRVSECRTRTMQYHHAEHLDSAIDKAME
jgi:hypothetical protein